MSGTNAFKHGGNLFKAMRQMGKEVNEIIDFSANINPLGLSDTVFQALQDSLQYIIHYPDAEAYDLKATISNNYQVEQQRITLGNGAVEPIYILCHMLKPKRVMVTAPTFSEYERAARASGASIDYFYLYHDNGFNLNLEIMSKKIAGIDIIFVCNPNNPTGVLLTNQHLEILLAAAQKSNTLVVVDESFIDFLPDDTPYTCRKLLNKYTNLVIVHSLTKFYAIPGLRLGFVLANPYITDLLHRGKDPWNVNTLAQAAGVAALQDQVYRAASKNFLAESKNDLYTKLTTINKLVVYKPSVNFLLVNIGAAKISSGELRQKLIEHNILIRDCSNYPGLSCEYIRLAVKKPKQHDQLLLAFKQVLGDN